MEIFATVSWAELYQNSLLCRYILEEPEKLASYFENPPIQKLEHLELPERAATKKANRQLLSESLYEIHKKWQAPAATFQNIQRLAEDKSLVLVGGQQVGLLLGPLYTFYKALSLLSFCRFLESIKSVPVIPVFWMATEDHDLAEVDHVYHLDSEKNLEKVRYPFLESHQNRRIGELNVEKEMIMKLFGEHFPKSDFQSSSVDLLNSCFEDNASVSMGDFFARLLLKLLPESGLVIFDPLQPALKNLSYPIYEKAILKPLELTKLANSVGQKMQAEGLPWQIHKPDQSCSFFIQEKGLRKPVFYENEKFKTDSNLYNQEDLLSLLKTDSDLFSANALLRPIICDYLLGASGQALGLAEFAYYMQIQPAYQIFQVAPSYPLLRLGFTLIEPTQAKFLQRHKIHPQQLLSGISDLRKKLVLENLPAQDLALWQEFPNKIASVLDQMQLNVEKMDPSLVNFYTSSKGKIDGIVSKIQEKMLKSFQAKEAVLLNQLEKSKASLYPQNQLQERTLNLFYFINKYGLDWMEQLSKIACGATAYSINMKPGEHSFIFL